MNKIRILKASPFYVNVINNLYIKNPDLSRKSYNEQYRKTMDTYFSWADIWKVNLENIGGYEVEEIVTNNEFLQKKWAEENQIKFDQDTWLLDI